MRPDVEYGPGGADIEGTACLDSGPCRCTSETDRRTARAVLRLESCATRNSGPSPKHSGSAGRRFTGPHGDSRRAWWYLDSREHHGPLRDGLPVSDDASSLAFQHLGPLQRKQATIEALLAFFRHLAAHHEGSVVALDDLQWADPSTWDVVPALIALRDLGPLLLLLLARPDPPPPWPSAGRVVHVELAPLTQADGRAPLAHLFPVEPDSRLTSYVMEQAGGNPFYVEELVRALREQGAIQIRGRTTLVLDPGQLGIPDSVQGVITARLDRLDDAQKRILEVASVVGRTFEATLIGQVRGHPVKAVALVLDELVHQGFDSPREMPGTYGFIHALTRDVVYGTPLKRVLRDLHRQVAEAHLVVDPTAPLPHRSDWPITSPRPQTSSGRCPCGSKRPSGPCGGRPTPRRSRKSCGRRGRRGRAARAGARVGPFDGCDPVRTSDHSPPRGAGRGEAAWVGATWPIQRSRIALIWLGTSRWW
ncbi:MAG: AAA family ATPase [Myxococcota bacterium]